MEREIKIGKAYPYEEIISVETKTKIANCIAEQIEVALYDLLHDYKDLFFRKNPNAKIFVSICDNGKGSWANTRIIAGITNNGYFNQFTNGVTFGFYWSDADKLIGVPMHPHTVNSQYNGKLVSAFDYIKNNSSEYLNLYTLAKFCEKHLNWCENSKRCAI